MGVLSHWWKGGGGTDRCGSLTAGSRVRGAAEEGDDVSTVTVIGGCLPSGRGGWG